VQIVNVTTWPQLRRQREGDSFESAGTHCLDGRPCTGPPGVVSVEDHRNAFHAGL
jgi:hypothetical protein